LEILLGCARYLKCLNLLFADEITIQLTPTLSRTWGLRGQQMEVTAWPGEHRKTHVFGAMDPIRSRVYRHLAGTINSVHFVRFLRLLLKRYPRKELIVVLDNARWHKGRAVREFLTSHKRLKLFFLPKYSPDMNPIEPFWKLLRMDVTHNHFFGDLTHLKRAIEKGIYNRNREPKSIKNLSGRYVSVH